MQSRLLTWNMWITLVGTLPIFFVIACFILIKISVLAFSFVFPNAYIKIRKILL